MSALEGRSDVDSSVGVITIAVVEDHQLVRDGLAALMNSASGGLITVVYVGPDPIEAAMSAPDVALLDIDLGPGSKPVAANTETLVSSGIAVLLVSALGDARAVRSALDAGASGYVPKRASYEDLADAVACVARGEMYLSVELATILASDFNRPELSPRELTALRLYASGLKLSAVARQMDVSPNTAKEYLDRVRAKYTALGRRPATRTDMYRFAEADGLLSDGDPA